MKKDKENKLYEEPVIKVVKFQVELGLEVSPNTENPGTNDPIIIGPGDDGEDEVRKFGGEVFWKEADFSAF
jgi:hypothetical protein